MADKETLMSLALENIDCLQDVEEWVGRAKAMGYPRNSHAEISFGKLIVTWSPYSLED